MKRLNWVCTTNMIKLVKVCFLPMHVSEASAGISTGASLSGVVIEIGFLSGPTLLFYPHYSHIAKFVKILSLAKKVSLLSPTGS